ncbi:MAG: hydrolase TatD [Bdellovibrionales bacterium RBG_16_40_8]|nr:MAG: hydrolase TatD [Bdellovibrionales bacterium RBG_16_40_8]
MKFIDVHAHLNMLEANPEAVIQAAEQCGVARFITIGTGLDDHSKIIEYVKKYQPVVFGTLGFHPHDAKDFSPMSEKFMREHLNNSRIVAVGEIGLDYYYNHSPQDTQREVFRRQMSIANEFQLPVEIHTRDAEADTIDILKEFTGKVKGLLHCFTGTQWLADQALAIGYNISISGVVTFKNSVSLRDVVKSIPLDRLHIETDAPFLTPAPFRGKKNEPAFVVHTAKVVAELKGISVEELAQVTSENAKRLFKRLDQNW